MSALVDTVTSAAAAIALPGLAVLLNMLWQGALIAAACALALRACGRASARRACAICGVALLALFAVPLATLEAAPARESIVLAFIAAPDAAASSGGAIAGWPRWALPARASWPVIVFWVWATLAGVRVLGVARAAVAMARWRRGARLVGWRGTDGRGRRVRVAESDAVSAPVLLGLVHPTVVTPRGLERALGVDAYELVLLHELAHARRYDDWTQLLQRLVEALLFFHPAARWIGGRLELARELACDEWVVQATGRPRVYARSLTRVVELARVPRAAEALAPAMVRAGRGHLAARIGALVGPRPAREAGWARGAAIALALVLCVVGARAAPLFTFEAPAVDDGRRARFVVRDRAADARFRARRFVLRATDGAADLVFDAGVRRAVLRSIGVGLGGELDGELDACAFDLRGPPRRAFALGLRGRPPESGALEAGGEFALDVGEAHGARDDVTEGGAWVTFDWTFATSGIQPASGVVGVVDPGSVLDDERAPHDVVRVDARAEWTHDDAAGPLFVPGTRLRAAVRAALADVEVGSMDVVAPGDAAPRLVVIELEEL